jgi:HPt (histidine-containing phosphotransfer) domain-containing protein
LATVARDMEDRDYPGLQQTAHRLAGTFANAFAPGLQKMARRIELAAAAGIVEEAGAAYAELVQAAARFPEQLAEVIGNLKAKKLPLT